MNIVDLILLIGILWTARKGWQIGLLQSLVGLLSILIAYGAALTYGGDAAQKFLGESDTLEAGAALIGFLAVFAATLVACYLIGRVVHTVLVASPLGTVDAIGGGALGLAKGLLILGLLTVLLRAYPLHSRIPEFIDNAALAPPVQKAALFLADGIQNLFPKAKELLQKMGVQTVDTPPIVDEINKKADSAREKLDALIDESRKRLESQ